MPLPTKQTFSTAAVEDAVSDAIAIVDFMTSTATARPSTQSSIANKDATSDSVVNVDSVANKNAATDSIT